MVVATDGSPSSKKPLQFLAKQLTAKSEAKPWVILLVHVMTFLRYTMVKEGRTIARAEAAKLEKVGYRAGSFRAWDRLSRRS